MELEVRGKTVKDPSGKCVGIEIEAQPEAYSEAFVREFPQKFIAGGSRLGFVPGGVAFESTISGVTGKHQMMLPVEPKELSDLQEIFTPKTKLNFTDVSKMTPAFRITEL